ncbi:MAG: sodium-translocating pyrophosphatase [Clostridiales bacterium]|nr:sodium-translocating pyrophosphatase [Clostridiales bacterium]
MADWIAWAAPASAVLGIAVAVYLASWVLKQDPGTEKMQEISEATQQGALAFLLREYRVLVIFAAVVAIIIWIVPAMPPLTAVAFLTGAILSAAAGYFGMYVATRANTRTAQAATIGVHKALTVAFRSGLTMGLTVASFGLGGISLWIIFLILSGDTPQPEVVNGFAMGASSIALFARVGGGIYTKAADVGADLVGKVEAGIPEDDPRNPAVIADNVGDNVGDVAGMGADLFESFVGSIIAPVVLAISLWGITVGFDSIDFVYGATAPLLIAALGIVTSIIGLFAVRAKEGANLHSALNMGTYVAAALQLGAMGYLFWHWSTREGSDPARMWFFAAVVAGLSAGIAIGKITEYFCSDHFRPTRKIAEASVTGTATNIIAGIGTGMMSTAAPIFVVSAGIIISFAAGEAAYDGGGIYGIGLAALGMLSIIAITVGVDAYGPVADNAGGIAEMAGMGAPIRKITDSLDSVGNTTAAIAKGFAIGSAGLTALALFVAFRTQVNAGLIGEGAAPLNMGLDNPYVIVGLFIGGMLPFLFGALTMNAVGRAAFSMIEEVRRQFREIPGIMEGTGKPDYAACVDISTKASLKEMVVPGVIAVAAPLVVGMVSVDMLSGLLAGALVTGFLLAIFMANAGGAWDNAKKYIEAGNHGGKGSEAHKAAVVGDTVGDPFKDTSGPSMNILIKLMTIVSLVFVPLFVAMGGGFLGR